tara:strand:+ start:9857 stop:11050 length:1194 start_codon:yes stop_codon:yes gene_type:complete
MSVSINTVYQKVLAIANKEQRGYITPQEFNLFADQAQKEIFEQYFYDINQFNRVPGNQTEFSDQLYMLEEKISAFRVNDVYMVSSTELVTRSTFESGITTGWTDETGNNSAPVIVADASNNYIPSLKLINDGDDDDPYIEEEIVLYTSKKYRLKVKVSYANDPQGVSDSVGLKLQARSSAGAEDGNYVFQTTVVTNGEYFLDFEPLDYASGGGAIEEYKIIVGLEEDTQDGTAIHFSEISLKEIDNSTLATDIYRLGEVMYKNSGSSYATQVSEVSTNQLVSYNLSPLTRPTVQNPLYVRSNNASITTYPSVLTAGSTLTYNYVKNPSAPKWTYNVVLGKAVYNGSASDANNFELHSSEENNLVYKVLQLAGISMNRPDIIQAATGKDAQESQQQKS